MAKLNWDANGERFYEAGVDRGVFYPQSGPGLAWNGLISVNETSEGVTESIHFVDGAKYVNQLNAGSFAASIEAFTYPDGFEEYDGSLDQWANQRRKTFDFSYRTMIGNDNRPDHGYKLHLVYNALAAPVDRDYSTVDETSEAQAFAWSISTKPIAVPDAKPCAHLFVDSTKAHPWTLAALEDALYGTETTQARMPSIVEVIEIFEVNAILRIIDHGDGTWTAIGPDDVVSLLDATTFQIDWPTAIYLDENTYQVSSL